MARKAAVISIDINAGTAKMLVDLERAKGGIREFGSTANASMGGVVSSTKATTAAIKGLEGGFANNNKAAAAFLTTIVGAGPILQYAFPVFGLLAFGGVLSTIGGKVSDFFKELREGPDKVANGFRQLNNPLIASNDSLQVMIDKTEIEISKLEHKPENNLKLAIDEAKESMDKLGESTDKNLGSLYKFLGENSIGKLRGFFTGEMSTTDLQNKLGGPTGTTEEVGKINKIVDAGRAALDRVSTEDPNQAIKEKNAIRQQVKDDLAEQFRNMEKSRTDEIAHLQGLSTDPRRRILRATGMETDPQRNIDLLQRSVAAIQNAAHQVPLQFSLEDLTSRKGGLEQGKAARDAAEKALKEIEAYERSIAEGGLSPVGKIYAKRDDIVSKTGAAFSGRASNAANIEAGRYLTTAEGNVRKQTESIFGYESNIGLSESAGRGHIPGSAENELKKQGEEINKEADSILKTFADGFYKSFKTNFEQAKKANEQAYKVGNIDAQRTAEGGIEANTENKLKLEAQYASQRSHSYAEENSHLHEIAELDAKNLQLILQKAEAELKNAMALGDSEKIDEKGLEVDKASAAVKKQELETAVKQASLDAQHNASLKSGLDTFIHDAAAQMKEPGDILRDGLNSALDGTANQLTNLFTGKKTEWGKMLKDLGTQMVKESTKSMLQEGLSKLQGHFGIPGAQKKVSFRAGDPGHVIVDNLGQQGQSTDQNGLPLSNIASFPPDLAKSGGFWSKPAGWLSSAFGGLGGLFSGAGGAAGGGLTEAVSSSISFMASGGDVDPGKGYIVGDGGDGSGAEYFSPKTAGTITPMSKMGGGATYHIDARGAELGAYNRIARGIELAHSSAISKSAKVAHERTRRTPQMSH